MFPRLRLPLLLLLTIQFSCSNGGGPDPDKLRTGIWRMEFDVQGRTLPILFEMERVGEGDLDVNFLNGEETIPVEDVVIQGDSLQIRMPLFDSEFIGVLEGPDRFAGHWINHLKGPDHKIPVRATAGAEVRFESFHAPTAHVSGRWRVRFNDEAEKAYDAIGVFDQTADGMVKGTFLTETGDYRFLEGLMTGDSLKLSSFDGSRALLFEARLEHGALSGMFYSGIHWQEPWHAEKDPSFKLRDPDSLTFMKPGHDKVSFAFPDLDGNMVTSEDSRFQGHPYLLQVMGSWCANCMDESRMLNEIYSAYKDRGLEIVALAFEKPAGKMIAADRLKRFKERLGINYPILHAGTAGKEELAQKLPFIEKIMSYPTTIFIDSNGVVRRIYTGTFGPGTGEFHQEHKQETIAFIEELLQETSAERSGH